MPTIDMTPKMGENTVPVASENEDNLTERVEDEDVVITSEDDLDKLDEESKEGKPDGEGTDEDTSASDKSQDEESTPSEEETSEKKEGDEESSDDSSELDEIDKEIQKNPDGVLKSVRKERDSLMEEIITLRKERREAREQAEEKPLLIKDEDAKAVAKNVADELSDVNSDDVNLIERVVEKLGYVKADTLDSKLSQTAWQTKVNIEKDAWLEEHPEYKPENDPDDKNWFALQRVMKEHELPIPRDPAKVKKILNFAHSVVNPTPISIPKKSRAAITHERDKVTTSAKGSSGGGAAQTNSTSVPDIARKNLEGFSEEELAELFS